MIAVDTNILVRVITNDDAVESPQAHAFLSGNDIFVGATVVLETAWVLGKTYRMPPAAVVAALRAFLGLSSVKVEAASAIGRSLDWASEGMGVADAIHLSLAGEHEAFATFDRALVRRAQAMGVAVRLP